MPGMRFHLRWFRHETVIDTQQFPMLEEAKKVARQDLAFFQAKNSITHAQVRDDEGVLCFDTRLDAVLPEPRFGRPQPLIARIDRQALD